MDSRTPKYMSSIVVCELELVRYVRNLSVIPCYHVGEHLPYVLLTVKRGSAGSCAQFQVVVEKQRGHVPCRWSAVDRTFISELEEVGHETYVVHVCVREHHCIELVYG